MKEQLNQIKSFIFEAPKADLFDFFNEDTVRWAFHPAGFPSGGLSIAHGIHDCLTNLRQIHGCYHGERWTSALSRIGRRRKYEQAG